MSLREYEILQSKEIVFRNNADYCVGTGRMGLALQKEYFEQLKLVQEEIGFRYIRGHGLFADDMAIYQEYTDEKGQVFPEYNFTYLDFVIDNYLSLNIRPFLELGFMPDKMASGTQTVFYWKGNVTPPKAYSAWKDMVQATLRHFMDRYGEQEVLTWPIEVWNEPNLSGFWKNADIKEYFRLFEESFLAIKEVNSGFRVGGPAICGVDDERWIREFLLFCLEKKLEVDFITRHHYVSEPPERAGHYSYVRLAPIDAYMDSLNVTRSIVDSFEEYKDKEIHITEFNTSYVPNAPIHDTNYNAAYVARMLSGMGDINESYSYWTFGDIFEEFGVPFTPFHGGFGLVANGGIPKPTFWTFQFFKMLKGTCVHRDTDSVVVRDDRGRYLGVVWNTSEEPLELAFRFKEEEKGDYCLITKTVDEGCCNPLKLWHDMGEPSSLSKAQVRLLREGASPLVSSEAMEAGKGDLSFQLSLKRHGIVYFELDKVKRISDRGYSYSRVVSQR